MKFEIHAAITSLTQSVWDQVSAHFRGNGEKAKRSGGKSAKVEYRKVLMRSDTIAKVKYRSSLVVNSGGFL